jgi:hypothetical protein
MARKPNPNSVSFLKRQVVELVAVNEALTTKLEESVGREIELRGEAIAVRAEATAAEEEAAKFRKWWHDERRKLDTVKADRKRYEMERDLARSDAERWKIERNEALAARDEARAHAEMMRQLAYPSGPELPWDKVTTGWIKQEERVGDVSRTRTFHGDWRG